MILPMANEYQNLLDDVATHGPALSGFGFEFSFGNKARRVPISQRS